MLDCPSCSRLLGHGNVLGDPVRNAKLGLMSASCQTVLWTVLASIISQTTGTAQLEPVAACGMGCSRSFFQAADSLVDRNKCPPALCKILARLQCANGLSSAIWLHQGPISSIDFVVVASCAVKAGLRESAKSWYVKGIGLRHEPGQGVRSSACGRCLTDHVPRDIHHSTPLARATHFCVQACFTDEDM